MVPLRRSLEKDTSKKRERERRTHQLPSALVQNIQPESTSRNIKEKKAPGPIE